MNKIKRRHFFQLSSGFLTALGLSQFSFEKKALKYGKVLAQSTPRKLALLVGINQYQSPIRPLKGCGNDVYLQRELLIHRFGFNPKDIILVTDDQREYPTISPTRENILTAFEEHLIKQAQPEDVVVFHYSGHGSQVADETEADGFNSTFIPIDRTITERQQNLEVSDITGHTLFLLMYALKAENSTAVLDACHSGGGTRGNLTIRAFRRPTDQDEYASEIEFNYQDKWLSELGMTRKEFEELYRKNIAKGVVVASAKDEQLALEKNFDKFSSGVFTYALTQYLWQATGDYPLQRVMNNVGRITDLVSQYREQNPIYEVYENSYDTKPIYFLNPDTPPAEGMIKSKEGSELTLWLGGFNPQVLTVASQDAIFEVLDSTGTVKGEVKVISRKGLEATAIPHENTDISSLKEGDLIREKAIAIPEYFTLNLGLDDSLGSDKKAIESAIINIDDRIKVTSVGTGEIHYILGKMTSEMTQELEAQQQSRSYVDLAEIPTVGSIGLYNSALEMIPGSFGQVNESLNSLENRLVPKLRSLLTLQVVQTLFVGQENRENQSRLKVSAMINIVTNNGEAVLSSDSSEITGAGNRTIKKEGSIPLLPLETETQLKIINRENGAVYMAVLVLNPTGDLGEYPLFPETWDAPDNAALVAAGETFFINELGKKVPQTNDYLTVQEPLGNTEILVLASKEPLRKALIGLQQLKSSTRSSRGGLDIIGDIVQGTRGYGSRSDRSLAIDQVGSASITFKAIAP